MITKINRVRFKTHLITYESRPLIKAVRGMVFIFSRKYYHDLEEFASIPENREIKNDVLQTIKNFKHIGTMTGREIKRKYDMNDVYGDIKITGDSFDDFPDSIYHLYRLSIPKYQSNGIPD